MTTTETHWTPSSWRSLAAAQQPEWPDEQTLQSVLNELQKQPPLVFAGEARALTEQLESVQEGNAFLLVGGDCSESFTEFSANNIRDKLKVMLQMAAVLTYSAGVPTVKIGRMAGQLAKWRSSDTEERDGVTLPSYRGDLVNGIEFSEQSRTPDPNRILRGYYQSAACLNLIRALTKGGFADLSKVHAWNLEYVATSSQGKRFEALAQEIDRALRFMEACGIDLQDDLQLHQVDFWTAHEGLLLGYEEALTRQDSLTDQWYDCSAHLLWIGARTAQIDGAHVEFYSGIRNPIGLKVPPTLAPEEIIALCDKLNPTRQPGRLSLFSRMGKDKVEEKLPPILRAIKNSGHPVVWGCDPMHGNTFVHASGYKTRHFDDIVRETELFFKICSAEDIWPGGLHVELTGDDVTECLGGAEEVSGEDLESRYETTCDPRLNARQSLELAFLVCELLRGYH